MADTTQTTTAALLSTLTAAQGYRLGRWCRQHADRLAAMPASDRQRKVREQVEVLKRA